ncbi:PadR family transcriptional regulator [Sphaerimonospora thailandensis]|uniref:PadR family transcriptional regulator n=1 Tax=Sphaerimonospora thailandensis TaxID=795644 RepID=A0A8J3RA02_9ACTN|nr:PadR family transcriptional regulator [Sphaerimonospora thailandensis]GIH70665.1 PadR family transcriptional regulator [Sphaerimonospora thailandensis]
MASGDLALTILGFLAEEPMHGYELKQRIAELSGHVRPVSDGALYPAIVRLEKSGMLNRREEEGSGAAPRQVLALTETGREELVRRLCEPSDLEISDRSRYFTLLAFLSVIPAEEQVRVLRRRLGFLETPASFFYRSGSPVKAAETTDRFRRGMLVMAQAISTAEKEWLRSTIAELETGPPAASSS